MARVMLSEVLIILPISTQLTHDQIRAAIDAASCTVDRIVDCAPADCLVHVEKYLAAHYAAATENTLTLSSEAEPCSDGKVVYGFTFGEGVKGTPFGIMANTISGGCLAELDKQPSFLKSIGCA